MDKDHTQRVQQELRQAGVSKITLHKFTTHYLPRVIHPNEHIHAAVYGRHKESEGMFGLIEGALVATDTRVIFINHQPGYTTMDEVGYDKVSGINISRAGFYASITLFTKIANYTLSFASPKSAKKFADYIEDRTERHEAPALASEDYETQLSQEALAFLQAHELGVLSSIERTGTISGAAIYYKMYGNRPYFVTKTGTRKAANILGNQHVALTVVDEQELRTVQLQGVVEPETDELVKADVSHALIHARYYKKGYKQPPVTSLKGKPVVFRIRPTKVNLADYNK